MGYVGNPLPANFQASPAVVRFSGDGSDTTFALGRTISNVQDILVSVDGVVQDSSAYTIPDGSTLTFSAAPSSGTNNIFVYFLLNKIVTLDYPIHINFLLGYIRFQFHRTSN